MSLPCHQVERMRPVIIRDNAWAPVIRRLPGGTNLPPVRYPGGNLGRENLGPCKATTWRNCTFAPWISSTGRPLRRLLSSPCCCSGLSGRPSAVRLCSPCGSWCHGNTRTAPSAQSSSGWSPTHGESAGIRPSDVSKRRAEGTGPPKEKELRGGRPPPPCVSTEAQGASGLGSPQSGRAGPTPGATKSVRAEILSAAPRLSLDFQCRVWY